MLLGELLVTQGLATAGEIKNALALQERYGGRIGEHLIDMGVLTKDMLEAALRRQYEQAVAILAREDLLGRSLRRYGEDHPQTHRQRSQLASVLIAGGRADGCRHRERQRGVCRLEIVDPAILQRGRRHG